MVKINEFEHLNLASSVNEVSMNIKNMRKACIKYLSEERFKPPPTKEELAQMAAAEAEQQLRTGHQKDPNKDEDDVESVADDEWTWVKLHEAREKLARKCEKLEEELYFARQNEDSLKAKIKELQEEIATANKELANMQKQLQEANEIQQKLLKKLNAWPDKALKAQTALALKLGNFLRVPMADDDYVLDKLSRSLVAWRIFRLREMKDREIKGLQEELAASRRLTAELRAEIAHLTNELAEQKQSFAKLKAQYDRLYAELYGGGGERINVVRAIALRMSELHKENERRRIVAEWNRYAQMKKQQRAMGIESSDEDGEPDSPSAAKKKEVPRDPVAYAKSLNEDLTLAQARIKELEAKVVVLSSDLETERDRAIARLKELEQAMVHMQELQEKLQELESILEFEKSQRGDEAKAMRAEIEALKRQINELVAGDPYMIWMEGRIEQLLHENDVLTDHRDMYLANRRRVAPESVGELCVRCATQVMWRDWLPDPCPVPGNPKPRGLDAGVASIEYNLLDVSKAGVSALPRHRSEGKFRSPTRTPPTRAGTPMTPDTGAAMLRPKSRSNGLKLPGLPEIKAGWV